MLLEFYDSLQPLPRIVTVATLLKLLPPWYDITYFSILFEKYVTHMHFVCLYTAQTKYTYLILATDIEVDQCFLLFSSSIIVLTTYVT